MNLGFQKFRALQVSAEKQKQIKGGRGRAIIVTDIDAM